MQKTVSNYFCWRHRNSLITFFKYGLVFNVQQSTIFNILHIKYFVFEICSLSSIRFDVVKTGTDYWPGSLQRKCIEP